MPFLDRASRPLKIASVVAVVAAALSFPLPASAGKRVEIDGGGWGHGIGMSQYGAYGRAKNGATAQKILTTYYSGTVVAEKNMPGRIRVGLLQYQNYVGVTSSAFSEGGGNLSWHTATGKVASGGPGVNWKVEASPTGGMRLYRNGEQVKTNGVGVFGGPNDPLVAKYVNHGSLIRISEKGRNYAYGRMEFEPYSSSRCGVGFCLRLVVSLKMQQYLYGLGEVPSSWPQAVLQAQAIAGRTYAFEKVQRSGQQREPCGCAVYDSTYDQAYVGDSKRDSYWEQWKGAVDATKGQVILYKGNPIQALYSSSSGGYTENNENVWGGTPLPYLRGVPDKPDEVSANPNHEWSFQMSWSDLGSRLDAAYGIGKLQRIKLVPPFGVSGRVTVVQSDGRGGAKIVGSNKTVRVSGWSMRSALNLKDTLFRVEVFNTTGERFVSKVKRLDGAPGHARSKSYLVPRDWRKPRGRAQNFDVGRMYWNKELDKVVWLRGKVLDAYNRAGREASGLGMPVSDVWGPGKYRGATFTRGVLILSRYGAHTVRRGFEKAYKDAGGPRGRLGVPRGEVRRGRQRFEEGTLYRSKGRKGRGSEIVALWGAVDERYRALGALDSRCGKPLDMDRKNGRVLATFSNGEIAVGRSGKLRVACR